MYILSHTVDEWVTSVFNRQPAATCAYCHLTDSSLAVFKEAFSANITAAIQSHRVSFFFLRGVASSLCSDSYVIIIWNCIPENVETYEFTIVKFK